MKTSNVETVLVTGGTGFIAGWCIVELLQRGYAVRTTVRSLSSEQRVREAIAKSNIIGDRLSFFAADLTRDDGWAGATEGCDYVLHVASPLGGGAPGDRNALVVPARDGTLRVLRASLAAGVRRVVMTSAAAAARPPLSSGRMSDETVWSDPADPQFDEYRVSKILAERAAWEFMRHAARSTEPVTATEPTTATKPPTATELTTVLPGAVFGPILTLESLSSVRIIQGLLRGQPAAMPRLGFWVTDVRDLADLHIRAMVSPAAAGQRFIAAGEFMWMEDMANVLRSQLGNLASRVPRRRLPNFVVKLLLPFMADLRTLAPLIGRQFALTSEKAQRVLGFSPRPAATTLVDCARSLGHPQP